MQRYARGLLRQGIATPRYPAVRSFHAGIRLNARLPPLKERKSLEKPKHPNTEETPEEAPEEVIEWPPPEYRRKNYIFLFGTLAVSFGIYGYAIGLWEGAYEAILGGDYRPPTPRKLETAIAVLRNAGFNEIRTDKESLALHTSSPWTPKPAVAQPGAILSPRNVEDVQLILRTANMFDIPVIPSSGGTSIENQTTSPRFVRHMGQKPSESVSAEEDPYAPMEWPRGLTFVVNFSEHMNKVLRVNKNDLDAVVQPGISYSEINDQLIRDGYDLFFPVDPGPGAMIGGMIGTGCSGTNAVRYGTMRENVISLTVVLPNGEICKTRSRARKSSAGPDLTKLFIGSEGTLGLVVEATIKLQPIIPTLVGIANFDTLRDASNTVRDAVEQGVRLVCAELIDENGVQLMAETGSGTASKLLHKPSILFKFGGDDKQIKADADICSKLVKKHGGSKLLMCADKHDSELLWDLRKSILSLRLQQIEGAQYKTTDVCVPISNLPELTQYVSDTIKSRGLVPLIVGHAGDGNLHAIMTYPDTMADEVEEVGLLMVQKAIELDGTCTGEHGVGLSKQAYLESELGPGTIDLLVSIKRLIDPKNIMNPGKLYPIQKFPALEKEIAFK